MIKPTIFLGPPGTGKTTILLDTVEQEMANGVPPDRIGFMTFTKRGVEEAVTRAATRFNIDRNKFRYFNTLHSAAFRHLGLKPSQVFTGKKVRQFGETYGYVLHGSMSSDDGTYAGFYGDDLVLFYENYARITQRSLESILSEFDYIVPDVNRAWKCVRELQHFKKENGLYDFTDMIQEFIKVDDPPRLEVLFIDEAQDLSELQWMMVFLLARHVKRIYIAGDDDQTIFTWAGASERFISMPGCVKILEQSHRVPISVHALANRMITKVSNRRQKDWLPRDEAGSITPLQEVPQLDPRVLQSSKSIMMLGRTVKSLRQKYVPYCRMHGLLYRYFEYPSIRPAFAKAIDAWIRLQKGESIPVADAVSIYDLLPSEGHGQKPGVSYGYKTRLNNMAEEDYPPTLSMQQLKREYGLLIDGTWDEVFVQIESQDKEYIQKIVDNGYDILEQPRIQISTIHRVKGGQADTVVLMSETSKLNEKLVTTGQDEETRVFYTAVTRTFRDLFIVEPYKKYHYEGLFT